MEFALIAFLAGAVIALAGAVGYISVTYRKRNE